MNALQLSDGLSLPIDYVTKVAAIIAQRRKGKTYTASVIAEELVRVGIPWVALDPTGAWWGLRAGADGSSDGLPIVILGGKHGDLPLEEGAGKFIAELVVDYPGHYVLDLSLLDTRAAERRFATDFGEALLRRKRQPGKDFPLHLFVDEADMFAPQEKEGGGDARMLGAYQAIVRRGGLAGLGCTLITQRPALLNKSVLTQLDILILLRLVAGQDQDAVDKNYIARAAGKEQRLLLMESLSSLRVGQAWVWEPGGEPNPLFECVQIRERRTFNSSATPKPGQQRLEPKGLAEVDLEAVTAAMAEAIERAKADDPAELRKRIRDLERDLAQRAPERVEVEVPVEVQIDRPFVPEAVGDALLLIRDALERAETAVARSTQARPSRSDQGDPPPRGKQSAATRRPPAVPARTPPAPGPAVNGSALPGPQRKLLAVLATYGPRTKRQLAMQAGYSSKGGGFNNPLSALRSAELIERGDPIKITQAGLDALGPFEPLPTGQALIDHWMGQLKGPEQKILRPLIDIYPGSMTKDELAAKAGYAPVGGGFNNPLSRLRSLELVRKGTDIALTDDFGEAIL